MSGRLINSLREERLERRLSQQALADLAGISRQSYAAIESGASVPSTGVAAGPRARASRRDPLPAPRAAAACGCGRSGDAAESRRPGRVRVVRVGRRLMAVRSESSSGGSASPPTGCPPPLGREGPHRSLRRGAARERAPRARVRPGLRPRLARTPAADGARGHMARLRCPPCARGSRPGGCPHRGGARRARHRDGAGSPSR